jgi:ABC-type sugar transport system permease subunit
MITTIKYLFLLLPLSLGLGYIGASVINRLRIFKSSVLFVSFFPYIITPVVTCMLWNQLYYKFFTSIGEVLNITFLKINILSNSDYALLGVSIVDLWILVPYAILLFYSNLSVIPKDLVNAAILDGANCIKIFTKVELCYLLPTIGMITTVIISYVFTSIDTIMALTNGGPGRSTETFFYVVYRNSTLDQRFAYGTAEGIFISIISILIYILIMGIINHKINNISLED